MVGSANRAVAGEKDDFVEGGFRLLHPPDLIQPHLLRVTTVSNVSNRVMTVSNVSNVSNQVSNVSNQGHHDALTDSEGVWDKR